MDRGLVLVRVGKSICFSREIVNPCCWKDDCMEDKGSFFVWSGGGSLNGSREAE